MAVRTDFAAGEVLAAQDLDDTFASKPRKTTASTAPSSPATGDLWFDTTTSPAIAKFWDGSAWVLTGVSPGMVLLTTNNFTAVSAINIENIFSATYDTYQIIFNVDTTSTGLQVDVRLRVNGADNTTTNYQRYSMYSSTFDDTLGGNRSINTTLWTEILKLDNAATGTAKVDLYNPFDTKLTRAGHHSVWRFNNLFNQYVSGLYFNATTSFTGISFITNTGNITGRVSVYGLKK